MNKFSFWLGIIVAALIVVAGLIEFTARVTGAMPFNAMRSRATAKWAEPDPVLGWKNRPGAFELVRGQPLASFNSHGWRKIERQRFTRYMPEILFVGGSFTMGWGVADKQVFAAIVQKRLPSTKCVNLGVGGYGTYQALLSLEEYFDTYPKSDVRAVVYGFMAGHSQRNVAAYRWIRSLSIMGGVGAQPPYVTMNDKGELKPHPFAIIKPWSLAKHFALVARMQLNRLREKAKKRERQARQVTEKLMEEMAKLCTEHGARLLVLIMEASPAQALSYKDFLLTHNIDYVDCRIGPGRAWRLDGLHGDRHPNARAHEKWANCLVRYFLGAEGKGLWGPRRSSVGAASAQHWRNG